MNFFYFASGFIIAVVAMSYIASRLPMELPEEADPDEKDWSKL